MSENIQIVLGILFLVGVFILTRVGIVWKLRRTARSIVKELDSKGAVDVGTATELPYSKPNIVRIGMRDYHYKALESLINEGAVGKTDGGRYYLRTRNATE
ncbi:MAG: hypothetical protein RDU20_20420 [Desulfomonilaceae bacterium]|nr:hypothetical protein [Desulfomonilaceae bacterium]